MSRARSQGLGLSFLAACHETPSPNAVLPCNGFLGTIVASQSVAVAAADEGLKLPRQQLGGGGGGHGVNGSVSSDWDATCALRAHARARY